jgi:DNA-directed RNA polymerase specialized sigma24 family protein
MADESNRELLDAWRHGDEAAAAMVFHRYQRRLFALIRSRMARKLARRVDPEDVLMSAYRSFFVAVRKDRAVVSANDDLWPLLLTLAMRKLGQANRRHTAEFRSVDHEDHSDSNWARFADLAEPSPDDVAVVSSELENLLMHLDATAREVMVRTLQGDDVVKVASALEINERTVRRALERIRQGIPVGDEQSWPRVRSSQIWSIRRQAALEGTVKYEQYLLQQFVGAGAFSKVYRSIDRVTNAEVAIKFLRKDCWNDTRATKAMISEFDILKLLKHPNILRMREWGATPHGGLFLVTEFISGVNLSTWRAERPRSPAEVIAITRQVAEALSAAHDVGVLHCDLKPSNVMLRDHGRVVLCDFGLARHAIDPEEVPRGGTAGFLCPEQISDAFGPITAKSDVYGLGALLYCLLTGRAPMYGRDLPETMGNVLSATMPVSPSQLGERSSAELDALVLRCLAKVPDERFDSVRDVADALAALR